MWRRRILAGVIGAAALLAGELTSAHASTATPPQPTTVQADCSVSNDGMWCGNRDGALLYWGPNYDAEVTGQMLNSYSWFSCWQHGQTHPGGNDIWYWTQGDVANSHTRAHGWGFMPASDVLTPVNPAPGLGQCPFS